MKKLMFVLMVLCLFSLLCGQCLAYTVSGAVYDKASLQPVDGALVTLRTSSGSSTTATTDIYGSFSVGWINGNRIGERMLLTASKTNRKGLVTWKAMSNAEHKDVAISPMAIPGSHVMVFPDPVNLVGVPGATSVNVPFLVQAPGVAGLQVNNAQINLAFNNSLGDVIDMTTTIPSSDIAWVQVGPGQVQIDVLFPDPLPVQDFPAESFFDVMFEVDIPETGAVPGVITVVDALFNEEPLGTGAFQFAAPEGVGQLLIGEHELPSPYFLIDSEDEWSEGLFAKWPESRIIPMTPAEWNHPEWGYMTQLQLWHVEGEPYSPIEPNLPQFIPPGLFIYPGGDDGQSSPVPDPEDAGLVMTWGENDTPDGEKASAWAWDYGDPDLSNCIITVTAIPPGPSGINRISLGMQDINGNIRSWWWNVPAVIPHNIPTTVTVDTTMIGLGATNPPASGFANNPAFDLTKVQSILADENAAWVSGAGAPAPGSGVVRIWNYWNNLSVTPKLPATGVNSKWYVKYSQPPVEIEPGKIWGWDEVSDYNNQPIMADDWKCEDDRPITDIHWWGSFKGWTQPDLPPILPIAFRIGIWRDVPAGVDQPYSHPGELIWENECTTAVWNFAGYDVDPRCDDPQYPCEEYETCFQWAQFLNQNEWFRQDPMADDGTTLNIYWLSIAPVYGPNVDYADPDFYPWGWKTREHFFMDDAIRITAASQWPPVIGAVWTGGDPVEFPDGVSWDLAFELTTNEPKCPGLIADLSGPTGEPDCVVDLIDFSVLASEWLMTSP